MEIGDKFSSFEYWVAKGFITMAEAYRGKGDNFQAKATLESVIDNYDNDKDGVVKEAKELLQKIK